jgi:type II secretory pathway pseudopilin PulG
MKDKNVIKKSKSFTLIEALVVIFVVGVISSMMIVNWRKNENQYKLQRAAQEIMQNIRKAQDYALNGKQRLWPPTGQMIVPLSYGIHFSKNNPTFYFIYGDYIGNPGYQSPEDLPETNTWMETGYEIDSFGGGNSLDIYFSVPDGFAFGVPATITIKRTGKTCPSTYCRKVTVSATGEVSVGK